jgi:leucyl-tRNA synthetase
MELTNACQDAEVLLAQVNGDPKVFGNALKSLVLLLAPFAPYLAAELWEELGEKDSVLRAPWPISDPELAKEDILDIPGQVEGRLISLMPVKAPASKDDITKAMNNDPKIQARIEEAKRKARPEDTVETKIIAVAGKVGNAVVLINGLSSSKVK